jgi:hypothetical protein
MPVKKFEGVVDRARKKKKFFFKLKINNQKPPKPFYSLPITK